MTFEQRPTVVAVVESTQSIGTNSLRETKYGEQSANNNSRHKNHCHYHNAFSV
jgi:hypothetical protein